MIIRQHANDSSSSVGSLLRGISGGRHDRPSAVNARTTQMQFFAAGDGGGVSLMSSARDEKDSGYIGSASSRLAHLAERPPPQLRNYGTAHTETGNRCVFYFETNNYFQQPGFSPAYLKTIITIMTHHGMFEHLFLFQLISVVVLRCNSVLLHNGYIDNGLPDWVYYQTNFVIHFCNF